MPQLSTKLTFPANPALKLIDAFNANRLGGAPIHCPDATTLETWRAAEAQNVVDGLPIWATGQWIIVATDPPGTVRVWDGTSAFTTQTMGGGAGAHVITLTPNDAAAADANLAALQVAAALQKPVYAIVPGTYYLTPGATFAHACHIDATGVTFIRKAATQAPGAYLVTLSAEGVHVVGGTWDGNLAGNPTAEAKIADGGIAVRAAQCVVRDARIKDFRGFGINGRYCSDSKLIGNRISGCREAGIMVYSGSEDEPLEACEIIGNRVDMTAAFTPQNLSSVGIWVYREDPAGHALDLPGRYSVVALNRVIGPKRKPNGDLLWDFPQCISIRNNDVLVLGNRTINGAQGCSEGGSRSVISHNWFINPCGLLGWGVEAFDTCIVTDNIIRGAHVGITLLAPGQMAQGTAKGMIRGNRVMASYYGITTSNPDTLIEGNDIHCVTPHADVQTLSRFAGVAVSGRFQAAPPSNVYNDARNLIVRNNRFFNERDTSGSFEAVAVQYRVFNETFTFGTMQERMLVEGNQLEHFQRLFVIHDEYSTPPVTPFVLDNVQLINNRATGNCADWRKVSLRATINPAHFTFGRNIRSIGNVGPDGVANRDILDQGANQWMFSSESVKSPDGVADYAAGPGSLFVTKTGRMWVKQFGSGSRGWRRANLSVPPGFDTDPDAIFETIDELPQEIAYARAGTAAVVDWEGVTRTAAPNEARFKGVTRVYNTLPSGIDISASAPNVGYTNSTRVSSDTIAWGEGYAQVFWGGNYLEDGVLRPGADGQVVVFSVQLKAPDAANVGKTVQLGLNANLGADAVKTVTLTADWKRYAIVLTPTGGSTYAVPLIQSNGTTSTAVSIRRAQFEVVTGQASTAPSFEVVTTNARRAQYFRHRPANTIDGNLATGTGIVTESVGVENTGAVGLLIDSASESAIISGANFAAFGLQSSTMFTMVVTCQQPGTPTNAVALSMSDGTMNNRITVRMTSSTNVEVVIQLGGANVASVSRTVTAAAVLKIGVSIVQGGNVKVCVNGGAVATSASATSGLLATLNQARLGHNPDGTGTWGGIIKGVNLHLNTTEPTDAQMQAITT
jgi:hypothetical protein